MTVGAGPAESKVNSPHPRLRGGGGGGDVRGRMSHAGSEAGLRGIRRGPSAWLEWVVLVLVRFLLCFVVWFGWLFLVHGALRGLCLVPGLVRLLGLILVGGSSGKRRIFGKDRHLVSPARVPEREGIRRSSERIVARGGWNQLTLAGARLRTARKPHEVERSEADPGFQLIYPSELKSVLKASATISWVCVCVRGPV